MVACKGGGGACKMHSGKRRSKCFQGVFPLNPDGRDDTTGTAGGILAPAMAMPERM